MSYYENLIIIIVVVVGIFIIQPAQTQWNRRPGFQRQTSCTTPDNFYGTCVNLNNCPQIQQFFQTTNRRFAEQYYYALQRSCSYLYDNSLVCCTRPIIQSTESPAPFFPTENNNADDNSFKRNPQNPFLPPSGIIYPTSSAKPPPVTSAQLTTSSNCRTPDLKAGTCKSLRDCSELLNQLIQRQTDPVFADYIRASNTICENKGQNVCCPTNEPTQPTQPTATVPTIVNSKDVPIRFVTPQEGCGYTLNGYKKIVGGTVSKKGAWPWVALLGYKGDKEKPFKCGGTLITARHIITAAHCITNELSYARLGEYDLTTDTETKHVDINIVRKEKNPQYNQRNGRADIAVVYLEKNVEFNDLIKPICMLSTPALRKKSYVKHTPFVVGWGKTIEGGKSANILQELQIPVLDNSVCKDSFQKKMRLFSDDQFDAAVLCAGVLSGGMDTCQGDSGGPLMIPETTNSVTNYYLLGVVSYGIGCARPEIPGVYSSPQFFMDWITEKVADTK